MGQQARPQEARTRVTKLREAWEHRYAQGRDSGAGSRGERAQRKAVYINELIAREGIGSVVDYGCGDGAQLKLLEVPDYLGIDVSPTAIARCIQRHPDKQFLVYDPSTSLSIDVHADLALSMDVMFHLVDDRDFRLYVLRLFRSARRFVCIHATDFDEEPRKHVRHRHWTPYVAKHFPDWDLVNINATGTIGEVGEPTRAAEGFFLYANGRNPDAFLTREQLAFIEGAS